MQKILSITLLLLFLASNVVLAADTTFATKSKPSKKQKLPVNLYTQPLSPNTPQAMQGLTGQKFAPQINFYEKDNSEPVIDNKYLDQKPNSNTYEFYDTPNND